MKKSIELFTGAGGLALATHMAGFRHMGLYERDPSACATLRSNASTCSIGGVSEWGPLVVEGDIEAASWSDAGDIALVAGGPPCQPFSLGGVAKGMRDSRDMIPQFIRAVREAAPLAFLMENVRGLSRPAFADYLEYALLQLRCPGERRGEKETWREHLESLEKKTRTSRKTRRTYDVFAKVLNAADFGVPQCRERIFVVGFRSDLGVKWEFPEVTHSRAALEYEQWITGEYWERTGAPKPRLLAAKVGRVAKLECEGRPSLRPWVTVREAIGGLPAPFADRDCRAGVRDHRLHLGARQYAGHTGSPVDWPSKALKAGVHGVPGGENMIDFGGGNCRYLTVREAARLQTFPDTWRFEGPWGKSMRQIGNAVPVMLAEVVAKKIFASLESV